MKNIKHKSWSLLYLRLWLTFLIGISAGFCIAYSLTIYELTSGYHRNPSCTLRGGNLCSDGMLHKNESLSIADHLARKVKVLCWVMTHPAQHYKAAHVKATWGRRCNILLFMSTTYDETLPTVNLPVAEGYWSLWGKTKAAFRYVYEHHRSDADWFMKADDDTYVVVENLRHLLDGYDTSHPLCFGNKIYNAYRNQTYVSGGAGYVLSGEALDRFVNRGLLMSSPSCSPDDKGLEDLLIGECLQHVGVKVMDSRDFLGRGRFFPFPPWYHLSPGALRHSWWFRLQYYRSYEGIESCSNYAITFHYLQPNEMYELEYFLYHMVVSRVS